MTQRVANWVAGVRKIDNHDMIQRFQVQEEVKKVRRFNYTDIVNQYM
jgi:hypothetical protein